MRDRANESFSHMDGSTLTTYLKPYRMSTGLLLQAEAKAEAKQSKANPMRGPVDTLR